MPLASPGGLRRVARALRARVRAWGKCLKGHARHAPRAQRSLQHARWHVTLRARQTAVSDEAHMYRGCHGSIICNGASECVRVVFGTAQGVVENVRPTGGGA